MSKRICAAGLMLLSGLASAKGCEDSFQSVGDARNGLFFSAEVKMPGLSASSALGQLQQVALDGGYKVGGELLAGGAGELYFIQDSNDPDIVMLAQAEKSGRVSISTKLARGQKTDSAAVRTEFCSLLAKLKTGKEGDAIAAAAREKTGVNTVTDAKADKLSAEIGKVVKKALGPVASKGNLSRALIGTGPSATSGEYAEAFAPVRARYIGKKYRVDGQVYTVSGSPAEGMEVNYLVTQTRGLLGVRQESQFNDLNYQIKCVFARDQAKFFLTLSEGNEVTLAGTVTDMQPGGMVLRDCRQAN
ncbi:MAG TPA: hypothetical protein VF050_11230 [Moraxellaceae bacterium]